MTLAKASAGLLRRATSERRGFFVGLFCGVLLMAIGGGAIIWWKSYAQRSDSDQAIYDDCLARTGNTVSCDALMRSLERQRVYTQALKRRVDELLAAGFSKREIAQWAKQNDLVSVELATALGINSFQLSELLKDDPTSSEQSARTKP